VLRLPGIAVSLMPSRPEVVVSLHCFTTPHCGAKYNRRMHVPSGSNSGATAAPRSPLGSPASAETPEALARDSSEEPPSETEGGRGSSGRSSASFRFASKTPASGRSSGGNPFSAGPRWCALITVERWHEHQCSSGAPTIRLAGVRAARQSTAVYVTDFSVDRLQRTSAPVPGGGTHAISGAHAVARCLQEYFGSCQPAWLASRPQENAEHSGAMRLSPASPHRQPVQLVSEGCASATAAAADTAAVGGMASLLRGMQRPAIAVDISLYQVSAPTACGAGMPTALQDSALHRETRCGTRGLRLGRRKLCDQKPA